MRRAFEHEKSAERSISERDGADLFTAIAQALRHAHLDERASRQDVARADEDPRVHRCKREASGWMIEPYFFHEASLVS